MKKKDDDNFENNEDPVTNDHLKESNLHKGSVDSKNLKTKYNNSIYFNSIHSYLDEEFYNMDSNEVLEGLFERFNENLKNLFLIIESKINVLRELKIVINPHINIAEKIDYNNALIAFIYNVLKIIENMFNQITSLEIVSEVISFNYNFLGISSGEKKRKINFRKTNILNLTFNLKLDGYLNITKFMPEGIVYLNLVSMSSEIFSFVVEKLKKKCILYQSLVEMNLGVVLTNKDIEKLVNSTITLFEINKPCCLEVISFTLKYVLKNQDINKVIRTIEKSNDNVKRYKLNFGVTHGIEVFNRLDNKYLPKILAVCFLIKKSKIIRKAYSITKIMKLISILAFSFRKIIILD